VGAAEQERSVTEQNTATEALSATEKDETPEGSASGTPEPENGAEAPEPKSNREARFRAERNQAREALSAAEARIAQMQTREIERLAGDLAQPGDLLALGGVALADLLTEAGDVDSAAVADAVATLIASRPGLAKHPRDRAVDMSQGIGNVRPGGHKVSWADALRV
jgi:hypothetical protein